MAGCNKRVNVPRAAALSRICLVLGIAGGIGYFFFVLSKFDDTGVLVFHGLFSLILILLGIGLLFYCPYRRFSFLSNMLFLFFLYGSLVCAFWFRKKKKKETVLLLHSAFCLFLTLWKFGFTDVPFCARLPLNVCNILVLFIIFRPFYRLAPLSIFWAMLDNYIVCFGIIAGVVNYFVGAYFDDTSPEGSFGMGVFYYRMAESMLLHNVFISYSIYALVTGYIKIDAGSAMTNMIWIIPVFFLFVFINQIWKTDYFFTGVFGITPAFLKKLYYAWPWRFILRGKHIFEINPVHCVFVLGASALVLLGVSSLFGCLQRLLVFHTWEFLETSVF
jgi:hypothetical protein